MQEKMTAFTRPPLRVMRYGERPAHETNVATQSSRCRIRAQEVGGTQAHVGAGSHPDHRVSGSGSAPAECRGPHHRQIGHHTPPRRLPQSRSRPPSGDTLEKQTSSGCPGSTSPAPSSAGSMGWPPLLGLISAGQPLANLEWLSTRIQTTTVVNVYKPPPSVLSTSDLPIAPAPAIYAGDFNCQNTDWGYSHTTPDGETLSEWASKSIDFTHSSRKVWQTINQLSGRSITSPKCPVTANAIAAQLLKNGRFPDADKEFARSTSHEVSSLSTAASVNANLSRDFTPDELRDAMAKFKQGKAPGPDNIHPEFVIHQSEIISAWLCAFFSACLRRSKLPRTWRRAAIIALLKPNKPADDPKAYRPISLLCPF